VPSLEFGLQAALCRLKPELRTSPQRRGERRGRPWERTLPACPVCTVHAGSVRSQENLEKIPSSIKSLNPERKRPRKTGHEFHELHETRLTVPLNEKGFEVSVRGGANGLLFALVCNVGIVVDRLWKDFLRSPPTIT